MNPEFIIVATQNPKSEGFVSQRDELSAKFISRFTVVEFPSFEIDELRSIANGIAKKNNYDCVLMDSQDDNIIHLKDYFQSLIFAIKMQS